jgi:hypothetical protein
MAGRPKRKVGDVFSVPLENHRFGYGRILRQTTAFYDLCSHELLPVNEVIAAPLLFNVYCADSWPLRSGRWTIFGHTPLEAELLITPYFFMIDPTRPEEYLMKIPEDEPVAATFEQVKNLERLVIWLPDLIEDRLNNHFAGRPQTWASDIRPFA